MDTTRERHGEMSRRDFLGLGRSFGWRALQNGGVLAPQPRPAAPARPAAGVDIGTVADLAALLPGTVSTEYAGSGHCYLVRVVEGILALSRRCPEPGCAVLWRAGLPALPADAERGWPHGRFVCLAHNRHFDRYGHPAAESTTPVTLVRLPVVEDQGRCSVIHQPTAGTVQPEVFLLPAGP